MKIDDLLDEYNVTLFIFPDYMWDRPGFYYPDQRMIYVNGALDQADREQVILHELGHMHHDPAQYQRLLYKYENEADRFMVRHLIAEELKEYDAKDFNWYHFAKRHHISTTWGEAMIQEEFGKMTKIG